MSLDTRLESKPFKFFCILFLFLYTVYLYTGNLTNAGDLYGRGSQFQYLSRLGQSTPPPNLDTGGGGSVYKLELLCSSLRIGNLIRGSH